VPTPAATVAPVRHAAPAARQSGSEPAATVVTGRPELAAPATAGRGSDGRPADRMSRPASRHDAGLRPVPAQNGAVADIPARDQRPTGFDVKDSEAGEVDAPERRLGWGKIAAALLVAILAGIGGAVYVKRDQLEAYLPAAFWRSGTAAADPSAGPAPFNVGGTDPQAVDSRFQRTAIWRHIKQEFPEWYAERVQEAVKFTAEKRGEAVIAKHLAEAVVALRRKHAEQALTASPERLKFVATAFLDNLQSLAKQNVETCYGFISQGETYPAVLDMLQKPNGHEPMQKQVVAVFEAIADGRKTPQSHLPPRKADYDALAGELTARGWTDEDLRTFSDPRALGRASPQQVCRMVQDWFAAQIAIKDPASQLRLLVESLRPVVAG
jgi:hypothetical protein